jgi:hypothetical protein
MSRCSKGVDQTLQEGVVDQLFVVGDPPLVLVPVRHCSGAGPIFFFQDRQHSFECQSLSTMIIAVDSGQAIQSRRSSPLIRLKCDGAAGCRSSRQLLLQPPPRCLFCVTCLGPVSFRRPSTSKISRSFLDSPIFCSNTLFDIPFQPRTPLKYHVSKVCS